MFLNADCFLGRARDWLWLRGYQPAEYYQGLSLGVVGALIGEPAPGSVVFLQPC